jgi:hypothetical protein
MHLSGDIIGRVRGHRAWSAQFPRANSSGRRYRVQGHVDEACMKNGGGAILNVLSVVQAG